MTSNSFVPAATSFFSASRKTASIRRLASFPRNCGMTAEGAGMVAAFGNLEVAVMARGQLDIGLRNKVDERPLARRGVDVHGLHHLFILMRARVIASTCGMRGADRIGFLAHAAGHDHAPVFGYGLPDSRARLSSLAESRNPQVLTKHLRPPRHNPLAKA